MRQLALVLFAWLMAAMAQAAPLTVQTQGGAFQFYEESKALLIGISKYDAAESWRELNMVERELDMIEDALGSQFSITRITDPDRQTLDSALREFLLKDVPRNGRLLVFFAGHGTDDHLGEGYLVPRDAPAKSDPNLLYSLIPLSYIQETAQRSAAKHIYMVFDSCFAGNMFKRNSAEPPTQALLSAMDRPTREYLASGSPGEEVPDTLDFAELFIAGMQGEADHVPDGVVTSAELGYWIRKAMLQADALQTPQDGPDPDPKFSMGEFVLSSASDGRSVIPTATRMDGQLASILPLTAAALELNEPDLSEYLAGNFDGTAATTGHLLDLLTLTLEPLSGDLGRAPVESVEAIIDSQIALLTAVEKQADPGICSSLVREGAQILIDSGLWDGHAARVDKVIASYLEAVRLASNDLTVTPPTYSDFQRLDTLLIESGAIPMWQVHREMGTDLAAQDYCPTLIGVLEQVRTMPGGAGERLRAFLAAHAVLL